MRTSDRDTEFTAFVTAQRARLLRAARLLAVGDEALAEDLVQTTLTKVYVAWPKVQRADDPVRYAHRMLTNAFIDETRRAYRGRERAEAQPADLAATAAEPADPTLRDTVMAATRVRCWSAPEPGSPRAPFRCSTRTPPAGTWRP